MKKGLHVLTACPGFTASNIRNVALSKEGIQQGESPRNEMKMMTAKEAARHIANAIKKRKHRLLLTTQGKLIVLINKIYPKLMDRLAYNDVAKEQDSPLK